MESTTSKSNFFQIPDEGRSADMPVVPLSQQLREAIPSDHTYRFMLHDHGAIFSAVCDASIAHLGLQIVKTPVRSPQANALCERLIGTLRRECLDWLIPLGEQNLGQTLRSWSAHYNRGRPHA